MVAGSDRRAAVQGAAKPPTSVADPLPDFRAMPGYLIRRCKQHSTGIFMEACKGTGITPIQFAAMSVLRLRPGIDQTELGELAGLDPSTAGGVIQRLQRAGLLQRTGKGNRRICHLTSAGATLLQRIAPLVAAAQQRILAPLTARERAQLLRLMSKLNGVSNAHYTVPHRRRRRRGGGSASMQPDAG